MAEAGEKLVGSAVGYIEKIVADIEDRVAFFLDAVHMGQDLTLLDLDQKASSGQHYCQAAPCPAKTLACANIVAQVVKGSSDGEQSRPFPHELY